MGACRYACCMPDCLRTAELARKRGGPSGDAAAIPPEAAT